MKGMNNRTKLLKPCAWQCSFRAFCRFRALRGSVFRQLTNRSFVHRINCFERSGGDRPLYGEETQEISLSLARHFLEAGIGERAKRKSRDTVCARASAYCVSVVGRNFDAGWCCFSTGPQWQRRNGGKTSAPGWRPGWCLSPRSLSRRSAGRPSALDWRPGSHHPSFPRHRRSAERP